MVQNGTSHGVWTLRHDPHNEFRELCALSTTGELTEEEWKRLNDHIGHCDACRKLKGQYETVVAQTIPVVAMESGVELDDQNAPGSWSIEHAEEALMDSLSRGPAQSSSHSLSPSGSSRWKHVRRYAIAAQILAACSRAGYRIGSLRGRGPKVAGAPAVSSAPEAPPRSDPSATTNLPAHENKSVPFDDQSAALRSRARQNQLEVAKLKEKLSQLEDELASRSADLDRSIQDRAELTRQLTLAQADAQSLQARLNLKGDQTPQDPAQSLAFKTQVNNLNLALEEKDIEIAKDRELLQQDRDIRNLIGARHLYIAEIYDVAKTGDTQKPFGRVFYTKGKSLVFYGYDLDEQQGIKKDTSFQAWGRRDADRHHNVSLGLLHQDDANQKRWVLKFDDARTIAQIDAVFVTAEPEGGSAKPSGKPLLFTYLRLDPNHP